MVFVKGGCFDMGDAYGETDEKPLHQVCVDDFHIGKYEVTQRQWTEVMGWNRSNFKGCDDCPVEQVTWDDVQKFIGRLNEKTGGSYRLPTEAEWEYAARSGGKREKWAGTSNEDELVDYAWYDKNSGKQTHPVGRKRPDGLGIHDMSGNVWEFVSDLYDWDYYSRSPRDNPQGPSSGLLRVARGGSWNFYAYSSRAAVRLSNNPTRPLVYSFIGFRLARTK